MKQAGLPCATDRLLHAGGYPRIHAMGLDPASALGDYFETYVERDLRQLAAVHDLQRFERFVRLCAGRTGQLLNLNNLANDTGVSQPTARAWLDLLQTTACGQATCALTETHDDCTLQEQRHRRQRHAQPARHDRRRPRDVRH